MRGKPVDDRPRVDVQVLAVAAPQRRPHGERRGAIPQSSSPGQGAVPKRAGATTPAHAAGDVLLQRHTVALFQPPALCRHPSKPGDDADVFVAHDLWTTLSSFTDAGVAAAHPTRFDF